jgi:hypothetical protein
MPDHSRHRSHTFSRRGWADAVPSREPLDPGELQFSTRPDKRLMRRPPPRTSGWWWLVLCIACACGLYFLFGAMLARSASTAGASATVAAVPMPVDQYEEDAYAESVDEPLPIATSAPTDLVYKCVGAKGDIAYQSHPCDDGRTMRDAYPVVHDNPYAVARARREQQRRSADARALERMAAGANTVGYVGGTTTLAERRAACAAAKAHRAQVLETVGLSRTYDLLQQLDAQVYEACKGLNYR